MSQALELKKSTVEKWSNKLAKSEACEQSDCMWAVMARWWAVSARQRKQANMHRWAGEGKQESSPEIKTGAADASPHGGHQRGGGSSDPPLRVVRNCTTARTKAARSSSLRCARRCSISRC